MIKKIIKEIIYFGNTLRDDNINAFAAHSAYFFILSFIPLIMLLMSLVNFTNVSEQFLIESVTEFFPAGMRELVTDIIGEIYHRSGAVISVTAIFTLWSAGKGMAALKKGMYQAAHVEKSQSFLIFRLTGALNTLAFILVVIAALILGVFGESIEGMLTKRFEITGNTMWFILQFRRVIMFVIYIAIFTALYRLMPDWDHCSLIGGKSPKLIDCFPGAAIGAIGWHLYSYAFSIYIKYSKGFENMYGSLGALIGIMLWVYGCMYVLLAGLEINMYLIELQMRKKNKDV